MVCVFKKNVTVPKILLEKIVLLVVPITIMWVMGLVLILKFVLLMGLLILLLKFVFLVLWDKNYLMDNVLTHVLLDIMKKTQHVNPVVQIVWNAIIMKIAQPVLILIKDSNTKLGNLDVWVNVLISITLMAIKFANLAT